jgi:hypothetical protein
MGLHPRSLSRLAVLLSRIQRSRVCTRRFSFRSTILGERPRSRCPSRLSDWTRQSDVLLSNTPATTCDDERERSGKVQDEINRKECPMLCVGIR